MNHLGKKYLYWQTVLPLIRPILATVVVFRTLSKCGNRVPAARAYAASKGGVEQSSAVTFGLPSCG
ncbi:hypothetical protein ACWEWI_34240 [Streptomyces sp. NPDC003753]|uniref:hypothetical protein n=1 Tax=Streptomyces sp. NPDC058960 TaxID=3346679 RepID=UPI00369166C8